MTTIQSKQERQKQLILEHLKKTPIVQVVCEKAGISRATFYRWKKEDPNFQEETETCLINGIELMNDMAESQLLKSVRDGNMTGIIFWLKTRHKAYSTKVEVQTTQKEDVPLTDEEEGQIKNVLDMLNTPANPTEND